MLRQLLATIVTTLVLLALAPARVLASGTPTAVTVSLVGANYSPSATYSHLTNVSIGNSVSLYLLLRNDTPGTTIDNGFIRVSLPSASSDPVVTATLTGANLSSPLTDSTTFHINNGPGVLNYRTSSTVLNWNSGSQVYSNVGLPDGLTAAGFSIDSPIQYGSTYKIELTFLADVASPPTVQSSSTSTSSNVCSDSKPGKTSLTSIRQDSPTSARLVWTKADNASSYAISYGLAPGKYLYGTTTTDTQMQVAALDPKATYYFVVTPIKGCMSGDRSNELTLAMNGGLVTVAKAVTGLADVTAVQAQGTVGGTTVQSSSQSGQGQIGADLSLASATAKPKLLPKPQLGLPSLTAGAKVMILLGLLALIGAAGLLFRSQPATQTTKRGRPRKQPQT